MKSLGICFYSKLLSLRSDRIIVLNLAYSHLLFQRHSGLFPQKADNRIITGNNMTYESIYIFVELNHVRNNDLMGFPNKKFIFGTLLHVGEQPVSTTNTANLNAYPQDVQLGVYQIYRQLKTYAESKAGKLSCEVSQKQYYSR